jgi:hypothetical protein
MKSNYRMISTCVAHIVRKFPRGVKNYASGRFRSSIRKIRSNGEVNAAARGARQRRTNYCVSCWNFFAASSALIFIPFFE